jgi:hypothetical protein
MPVARLAPHTIAGVMTIVWAACVVAIAPTAFIDCTGIGACLDHRTRPLFPFLLHSGLRMSEPMARASSARSSQ